MFSLGILAFLDSLFNYGEIFRQVNSVFFMLVSLGLLVRTTTKIRNAAREKLAERMAKMEMELAAIKQREEERSRSGRRSGIPA
jgi:hypothetical protein